MIIAVWFFLYDVSFFYNKPLMSFPPLVALLAMLFTLSSNGAEILTGRAVKIADGDTFTLLDASKVQHKVRLTHIDTPEMGQAYSQKAKDALGYLLKGKTITVKTTSKDRYGRVLGEVFTGSVNVNQMMVAGGYAWHYKKYSSDKHYAKLEVEAKTQRLGLWQEASATPPWEHRSLKKQSAAIKIGDAVSLGYWLNTSSNSRHNSACKWYKKTKRGRSCSRSEGKACGQCGG